MQDDRRTVPVIFRHAVAEFDARVRQIGDHQWQAATPDEDWTVRDLVNHLVGEDLWAPAVTRLCEDERCRVLLVEAGPDYPAVASLPADIADGSMPTTSHDWGLRQSQMSWAVRYPCPGDA